MTSSSGLPSKASFDVVAISPMKVHTPGFPSSLTSGHKRKVTPTAEASSPRRKILITPSGVITSVSKTINFDLYPLPPPPRWLFPTGEAKIDARSPLKLAHGHPEPGGATSQMNPLFQTQSKEPEKDTSQLIPPVSVNLLPAKHIYLHFDLRTSPGAWGENARLLADMFPGNGFGYNGWCLIYWMKELPPKPWPKTIAGVPCFFSLDIYSRGPGPVLRPLSRNNPQIGQDIDGRELSNWDQVFQTIKEYFEMIKEPITEVMRWRHHIMIVLEIRTADLTKIPSKCGGLNCFYIYEDEMDRPKSPQACRLRKPMPGNPDDTQYEILRPGVRLTSGYDPAQPGAHLRTSSGVMIQDSRGNSFMTVASHGFPDTWGTKVYHPTPAGGEDVGELIMEITHTDVALFKLKSDKEFENITFESSSAEPVKMKKFVDGMAYQGTHVMLDSPDTGLLEGSLQVGAYCRVPCDDPLEPEQYWIQTLWFYCGQDGIALDLPDGICGSAVYDGDGSVFGFFRYAPKSGAMADWCCGIAARELMDRGYTVVDPTMV